MNSDARANANRTNWDERVAVHLGPRGYDLTSLRAGRGQLDAITELELPPVQGKRVLHLQCHFGKDTLSLAQRGAKVVGLDFSPAAIQAARALTKELGLADKARFVQSDLYDAPTAIPEQHAFDLVFVTWGALCWLSDIARWAEIVAHFVKPGGSLYLAESHPAAMVLDDTTPQTHGKPSFHLPYFHDEPLMFDSAADYADSTASLSNTKTYEWIHPLGRVVTALIKAGLQLAWLHEHDAIAWQALPCLTKGPDRLYRWPDTTWLPLSYSLLAVSPEAPRTNR